MPVRLFSWLLSRYGSRAEHRSPWTVQGSRAPTSHKARNLRVIFDSPDVTTSSLLLTGSLTGNTNRELTRFVGYVTYTAF